MYTKSNAKQFFSMLWLLRCSVHEVVSGKLCIKVIKCDKFNLNLVVRWSKYGKAMSDIDFFYFIFSNWSEYLLYATVTTVLCYMTVRKLAVGVIDPIHFYFTFTFGVMLPTCWFSVWWCFWGAPVASISISCPSCSATEGVVRNGKSTAGHQRYLCSHCRKTWQLQFTYTASQPGTHQKIIDMAMNGVGCRASARIMGVGLNTILRHLKNSGRSR